MLPDETSIKRQLQRDRTFRPPYCPNPKCEFHRVRDQPFYRHHGVKRILRFPYETVRFQCIHCDKTFSASFFRLDYQQKIWGLNESIWNFHMLGVSKRETARQLNVREHLVRMRLSKMARWALLRHVANMQSIKILEPIVYDGLENFSFSQYDPNNIQHAVGKKSLFIYDFNFCPLNRKGRMSPRQMKRKGLLENIFGTYPKSAIRTMSARIFERLSDKAEGDLVLYSDQHYQYRRAIEFDLPNRSIKHITISSKVARNFKNLLFAVNNIDLQARHNLAAFKRETIAFSKHSIAMQESFMLYATFRNYMRPKFWGTHRSDPDSSKKSPAMELGLEDKILGFREFFRERVAKTHVQLHEDWENLYQRRDPLSRRKIARAA